MAWKVCDGTLLRGRCRICEWVAQELAHLDLSPLAKWIKGPPENERIYYIGTIPKGGTLADIRLDPQVAHMYGWEVFPTPEPTQPPEPSPMDKALDEKIKEAEFVARRKAKRDATNTTGQLPDGWRYVEPTTSTERALGRAMSKLIPAEMDFRSRLVNAKVRM